MKNKTERPEFKAYEALVAVQINALTSDIGHMRKELDAKQKLKLALKNALKSAREEEAK